MVWLVGLEVEHVGGIAEGIMCWLYMHCWALFLVEITMNHSYFLTDVYSCDCGRLHGVKLSSSFSLSVGKH